MSDNKDGRIIQLDGHKPLELMTTAEKDEYFKSFCGLTYAEFCEKYKNDTIEEIDKDLNMLFQKLQKHSE